jgi:hypothetical protein
MSKSEKPESYTTPNYIPVVSTPEMRNRIRELATPPRDDFDRAVLIVLDDFERLHRGLEIIKREDLGVLDGKIVRVSYAR